MKKAFLALFFFVLANMSFAQCAMCKATAESSGSGGGLNSGILYLIFAIYAVVGGVIFFFARKKLLAFYREFRKKDKKQDYTPENWY